MTAEILLALFTLAILLLVLLVFLLMPKSEEEPKGYLVRIPPEALPDLDSVCERTGEERIEVIRRALALFDLLIEQDEQGGKLYVKHADGSYEPIDIFHHPSEGYDEKD